MKVVVKVEKGDKTYICDPYETNKESINHTLGLIADKDAYYSLTLTADKGKSVLFLPHEFLKGAIITFTEVD